MSLDSMVGHEDLASKFCSNKSFAIVTTRMSSLLAEPKPALLLSMYASLVASIAESEENLEPQEKTTVFILKILGIIATVQSYGVVE